MQDLKTSTLLETDCIVISNFIKLYTKKKTNIVLKNEKYIPLFLKTRNVTSSPLPSLVTVILAWNNEMSRISCSLGLLLFLEIYIIVNFIEV